MQAYVLHKFYTTSTNPFKFLALLSGRIFRVDIDNSAVGYYSAIFSFYFVYTCTCNLVFVFVRVIVVKVNVCVCEDGVKVNYFHSILNQREP